MTGTSPAPAAWAARQVGLPPDAAPAEVRAALLREVTCDGFVPPPDRQQAWQALCGSRPHCPPAALLAAETRLRNDIDDFAASFFATPIAARRQRWQELSDQCAFSPPLAARLAALAPGLELDLRHDGIGNPRTEQLASHVAGLFVLAPAARAAQRQAVLRGLQTDIAGWEEAARQLQATFPALAALEPTLLPSILNWREQQRRLARRRERRAPPARSAAAAPAPAATAPARSGAGGKALGGVAVFVVIALVRVFVGMGSHSSSRHPPPQPPPKIEIQKRDPKVFEERKAPDDWMNRNNGEPNKPRGARPGDGVPRTTILERAPDPRRDDRFPPPRPDARKP